MNFELLWWIIPAVVVASLCYIYRWLRILTVIAVGVAIVFFPAINKFVSDASSSSNETSVITDYDLQYTLDSSGSLELVETLDVEFNEIRRGIFRFFDETNSQDSSVKHPVTVVSVQRCPVKDPFREYPRGGGKCVNEPYTTYYEDEYLVAKIGVQEKTYLPGTVNRYIITSRTSSALTTMADSADLQWYWDVIGAGWLMPIERAHVAAQLPTEPTQVRCITDSGDCPADEIKPTIYQTNIADLPPQTPVTWQAVFPPAGLSPTAVQTAAWWYTPIALIAGIIAALVLFALIWMLRDRKPSEAPVFAAPGDDILPLVWTWKEHPGKEPFQTVLLQLAQLGVVKIDVEGQYSDHEPEWVQVTRTAVPVPPGVSGASDLLSRLDLTNEGDTELIARDSVTIGEKLQGLEGQLAGISTLEAKAKGYFTGSTPGKLVHVVAALLAPVAFLVLVFTKSPFFASMFLIPAIAGLWSSMELGTRLTPDGLSMRDQVSGLRTALSTPASVERYDYALKARYFAQFLPWAVALDCADKWADACKPPPGVEVDTNSPYYAAASTYHMSQAISTAVASVSAGAVASYAATQSSSSGGGGGGFSSGGGSGGGGGGSW